MESTSKKCECELCTEHDKKRWETIETCKCFCHTQNYPVGHDSLCCAYPNGRKSENPYNEKLND